MNRRLVVALVIAASLAFPAAALAGDDWCEHDPDPVWLNGTLYHVVYATPNTPEAISRVHELEASVQGGQIVVRDTYGADDMVNGVHYTYRVEPV